ncbi:hypothetical protein GCM10017691_47890 [Pseudonocardia petroleophila]|uniref:Glycosyltransferase n=1 Tax=Pseudonocardia petroleophila TaxID=37331 RepID=A0A7G7MQG7_9PSEU|nr:glycosyltransferase [Pseudonocardia petroleophila]QNG55028.1 glycosyltransferase [Pseudonocardia petroleophila]
MRVLHVSQPVVAGVANVVAALAADQHERGHDVHVACPGGAGLAERVRAAGAVHHAWAAVRSPGPAVADETRRIARIIADVDPDVVVLHSAKAGLAGRLALRGARPTVYVPHAWSFEAVRGAVRTLSTAWEVLAGRWTDVAVCVSRDEADRGAAVGVGCAMEVVPNGVDTEKRVPRPSGPARAELGLPDAPTVVCVGRLAEQKGQDLLLAAWPAVRAAVPAARLVLVGDGPERPALEAAATPGVQFAGDRSDVDTWLAAADAVAMPSRWDSTPLASLEAMAAGRPVVAFDVDGVRATFGATGTVLPVGDVTGMADALVGLLRDPEGAAASGRAAREQIVAVGDLRTTLKTWDGIITGAAGPDRRPAPPLRVRPVERGLLRLLAAGALRDTDLAQADGPRAAALSVLGVPVQRPGVSPDVLARRPGAGTTGGPPVSVVMTILDEGPALAVLVDTLLGQLSDGDEIVVVDGGSTDGSLDALPRHPALRVETVPGAGISAGRNHGIRSARHDVLVCTDAGCTPAPGFVDGFRRAFAGPRPPALVSGVYEVLARTPLERAQSLACYPQPGEVRRPDLLVRLYTRVFGTGFDPRFAVGRCVAFTRAAWERAGGFPEHLATGEDVGFGLAVARDGECLTTTDAVVGWTQRDGLAATWRMYRGYGRASTDGGDRRLLVRDGARGLAYLVAPALLASPAGRRLVAAGGAAYLSLPVVRAVRAGAGPAAVALLPVALATKDLGKVAGALQGLARRWRR